MKKLGTWNKKRSRWKKALQKKKIPRRLEQGKKLAEWNRKNKKEVPAQNVPAQDVQAHENLKYWILAGGALVMIGLYFTNRQTKDSMPQQAQFGAQQAKPLPQEPTYDIFSME